MPHRLALDHLIAKKGASPRKGLLTTGMLRVFNSITGRLCASHIAPRSYRYTSTQASLIGFHPSEDWLSIIYLTLVIVPEKQDIYAKDR